MNFNHLEYVEAIVKYGSISKASQELLVSQPYLSGMVKSLEDELGYQIFRRERSGVSLTERGKLFLGSSNIILQELERIKSYRYEMSSLPLRIATYFATSIMNSFIRFQKAYPAPAKDRLIEMGNHEVMAGISSGDYNLGFIFYVIAREDKYIRLLEEHKLYSRRLFDTMPLYVVMSDKHPAAELEFFDLETVKQYPYVAYDDLSSIEYLQFLGLNRHQALLQVSSRAGFYDALRSGDFLTMLALFEPQKLDGFVYVPVTDSRFFINSRLVTRRNYKLSKREQDFLTFLKEEA